MKGAEALKYADMAIQRGANGVRAHYLRGRALALVGELKKARKEMLHVLQLDPKNADGQRALAMIDNALAG
jgi:predicted Zn-dependent protease